MSKFFGILISFLCLFLSGCGTRVEVPTGYVAKVMTPNGLQSGTKPPSSFRLPWSAPWDGKYYLVMVEASDRSVTEDIEIFVPRDQLNLRVSIRMMLSIPHDDDEKIESIFARINASETEMSSIRSIKFNTVYDTYVSPVIRARAAEVLSQYSIHDIISNRQAVSQTIEEKLRDELATAPIILISAGLAEIQPPPIIVRANEVAKEREIEIQRAEADKAISIAQADAALEVAKKRQLIDVTEAETQLLVDEVLAQAVSPAFVMQRSLKILEAMATSENKVFIIPSEFINNPAIMTGVNYNAITESK